MNPGVLSPHPDFCMWKNVKIITWLEGEIFRQSELKEPTVRLTNYRRQERVYLHILNNKFLFLQININNIHFSAVNYVREKKT